jgi:hypothetical protein
MNKQLRKFEKESGIEIYGLGARRDKWEAALEKYAELIVHECAKFTDHAEELYKHFGVEE